jgi:hypothetical protein
MCSPARVSVGALSADKLATGPFRFHFAPRTHIGVRAGFGSPGSITSGSVPGFSIGDGNGSGTGGTSSGGAPGLGARGLGTCCLVGSAEPALGGRLQFLVLRLAVGRAATGKLERLPQAVTCHVPRCTVPHRQRHDETTIARQRIPPSAPDGIDMSGWRPLIKGYFAVTRLSWVRSCLRPIDAGLDARLASVDSLPQSRWRA